MCVFVCVIIKQHFAECVFVLAPGRLVMDK